jgi:hypothetical protein
MIDVFGNTIWEESCQIDFLTYRRGYNVHAWSPREGDVTVEVIQVVERVPTLAFNITPAGRENFLRRAPDMFHAMKTNLDGCLNIDVAVEAYSVKSSTTGKTVEMPAVILEFKKCLVKRFHDLVKPIFTMGKATATKYSSSGLVRIETVADKYMQVDRGERTLIKTKVSDFLITESGAFLA